MPQPQRMTYREACKQAIRDAILADQRVFLMGEDVARYGGCYAVTKGLADELGEDRIRDTPLSEGAYMGAGIGAAIAGMRPIVEIMTVNFSLLALDQIVNNAATIPHMSGGQFAVPLVIRMATGAGRQLAAQHSHSLEGWYAHIPGIKVLAPATLEDARYMLQPALDDPNPVLIFEHVMLYNREDALDPGVTAVDIASAKIRRPGRDVTLITYGGSLFKTLEAADTLAQEGIEAEVIDLRVLRPAGHADGAGIGGAHAARGDHRRRLEIRLAVGGNRRPHRRGRVLRAGRADPPRLLARGADPLSGASGTGRAAAGAGDRRRGARTGEGRMIEFRMPSLGADMEAGTLVEWLVQPGDTVKRGDVVAVVETQKGAIEIEIFNDGTVSELAVPVGERVPVGTVLARLNGAGAAAPAPATPARASISRVRLPQAAREPPPVPQQPQVPARISPVRRAAAADCPRRSTCARLRNAGARRPRPAGSPPNAGSILRQLERQRAGRRDHAGGCRSRRAGSSRIDIGSDAPAVTAPLHRHQRRTAPSTASAPSRRRAGFDPAAMRQAIGAAMSRSKREIPHYYLTQTWTSPPRWPGWNAERRPAAAASAAARRAVPARRSRWPWRRCRT